jgi:hypothetical protein
MKQFLSRYILYVYLNFIKFDEYDIYKKWIIPYIKFIIFMHTIYVWIGSIIFFPFFLIGMIIEENKIIEKALLKNKKTIENILSKINI